MLEHSTTRRIRSGALAHFLASFAERHRLTPPELAADALSCLIAYEWPGNIRELKNVLEIEAAVS
jgi:formate hydrogenlyase transcriptional activator